MTSEPWYLTALGFSTGRTVYQGADRARPRPQKQTRRSRSASDGSAHVGALADLTSVADGG